MENVHVSVAYRTDRGKVREKNEDSFLVTDFARATHGEHEEAAAGRLRLDVGPHGALLLVSDGMGGQKAGEVASALVVEVVARAIEGAPPEAPRDEILKGAVARAHSAVVAAAADSAHRGMGATLTAVWVTGRAAYVAEVGDSRAYLLRAGRIYQLTKDQNLAQMLVDAGSLEPDEAPDSMMSHVLAQSMGHDVSVQPQLGKLQLRDRDCLLLCSDGLTQTIREGEIVDIVLGGGPLDHACDALVSLANQRGGIDNVTVVLAGVSGDLPPCSVDERLSGSYAVLESFPPGSQTPRTVPARSIRD
jgi:serine/threonine protein phosphatase PrpC